MLYGRIKTVNNAAEYYWGEGTVELSGATTLGAAGVIAAAAAILASSIF